MGDSEQTRWIVRKKFDEYLNEVHRYLDRELVQPQPFWKRWKAREELDVLSQDMRQQRRAVLKYAKDIAEGTDPVSENLHEYEHMQDFLTSNPLLQHVPKHAHRYDELEGELAQHFADVSREVAKLLEQDGDTFGELLSQAYDREEAEAVIANAVAQSEKFKSYVSEVDLGSITKLFVDFEHDIFPVITDAEEYVMSLAKKDLDRIYAEHDDAQNSQ